MCSLGFLSISNDVQGVLPELVQARLPDSVCHHGQLSACFLAVRMQSNPAWLLMKANASSPRGFRFGYDQGVFGGLITNEDFLDIVDHPSEDFLGFIGELEYLTVTFHYPSYLFSFTQSRAITWDASLVVLSTLPSEIGGAEDRRYGWPCCH